VQIFGQDLSAADLVPPAERAKLGEQGTTAALHLALKQRVWGAVFEDFMKKRSLEPSAGEIEECARKIQKSNADDWDPALGPIPLDLEFGGAMVRSWKLNSTLHRQYGGRVIFQQFGLEPIDAWRKLLEEYERNKAWVVPTRSCAPSSTTTSETSSRTWAKRTRRRSSPGRTAASEPYFRTRTPSALSRSSAWFTCSQTVTERSEPSVSA